LTAAMAPAVGVRRATTDSCASIHGQHPATHTARPRVMHQRERIT
jgi:hypothetical protein